MTPRNLNSWHVLADEQPAPPAELGDEAVRRRLGPSALKFYVAIIEAWKLSQEESRQLLALAPETNFDNVDPKQLSEEQLFRISYLLGIYRALHSVHCDELADSWINLPNTNVMFDGQTPMAYMIHGGLDALRNVRRLLDSRAAGN